MALIKYIVTTERLMSTREFKFLKENLRESRVFPRDVQNQLESYEKPIVWEDNFARTTITVEVIEG